MEEAPNPLAKLRAPFSSNQISKLPKPTKKQTDDVRQDFKKGIRCTICGAWHHPDVVHLDYVGHAALTDRLLDTDLEWSWEPLAWNESGLPAIDSNGGMWIKLTVCGVTRLGYGSADGKSGGDAVKELIGDALRNAAMRFGAALDLWHKGDLHVEEATPEPEKASPKQRVTLRGPIKTQTALSKEAKAFMLEVYNAADPDALDAWMVEKKALIDQIKDEFPGWWDGSETKEAGMDEQIGAAYLRLQSNPEDADGEI
jgi:hypothetical protein